MISSGGICTINSCELSEFETNHKYIKGNKLRVNKAIKDKYIYKYLHVNSYVDRAIVVQFWQQISSNILTLKRKPLIV